MSPPPVFTADLPSAVLIDGDAQPDLLAGLLALDVVDAIDGRNICRATFENWGSVGSDVGRLHDDRERLASQATVRVVFGTTGAEVTLFQGRLSGLEGRTDSTAPPTIAVLAEAFPSFRAVRRRRIFDSLSRGDLAQLLAGEHGLIATVRLRRDAVATFRQDDDTDLEMLARECARLGADTWLEGDVIHVVDRRAYDGDVVELAAGPTLPLCTVRTESVTPGATRETTQATVLAQGLPSLCPGRRVRLTGIGHLHGGQYLVRRVRHTFDRTQGLRTEFAAVRIKDAEGGWE